VTGGLSGLPHQIPFRATSRIEVVDAERATGVFHHTRSDALAAGMPLEAMVIEAMAQTAGVLAFRGSSEPGFLSAIDEARVDRELLAGDSFRLEVRLVKSFGRIHRFDGVAFDGSVEFARARFYLAAQGPEPGGESE
jgi:3-hydroxymyristoyl/3-hydroxydecanoyl-(acyl carrier protein) dehydratase